MELWQQSVRNMTSAYSFQHALPSHADARLHWSYGYLKKSGGSSLIGRVVASEISLTSANEPISTLCKRRCQCYDLYYEHIPYLDAWKWQKSLVEKRTADVLKGNDVNDALIILQHPPVYTLGTRSSEDYLLFDMDNPPCDVYRTERGGEVTYHGPGQLVMYPILNLRHYKLDLHWYLRALEEVIIRALQSACDIEASRIEGYTGVWVGDEKVAAIGVRVSRWITYHGLALNVTTDLSPFRNIVPCGIHNRPVGSVWKLLKDQNQLQQCKAKSSKLIGCGHEDDQSWLLELLHQKLISEFSEVFGTDIIHVKASKGTIIACKEC